MRFTVQNYQVHNADDVQCQWAVVLDHEHVMHVGTYTQCEEWLDRHDFMTETHGPDSTKGNQRRESSFRGAVSWFRSILRGNRTHRAIPAEGPSSNPAVASGSKLTRIRGAVASFLSGSTGCAEALDVIAVWMLVSMMAAVSVSASVAMTWNRAQTFNTLLMMSRFPRTLVAHTNHPSQTNPDSLEIACDLAQVAQ